MSAESGGGSRKKGSSPLKEIPFFLRNVDKGDPDPERTLLDVMGDIDLEEQERHRKLGIQPEPYDPKDFPDSDKENCIGFAKLHELMLPDTYERVTGEKYPYGPEYDEPMEKEQVIEKKEILPDPVSLNSSSSLGSEQPTLVEKDTNTSSSGVVNSPSKEELNIQEEKQPQKITMENKRTPSKPSNPRSGGMQTRSTSRGLLNYMVGKTFSGNRKKQPLTSASVVVEMEQHSKRGVDTQTPKKKKESQVDKNFPEKKPVVMKEQAPSVSSDEGSSSTSVSYASALTGRESDSSSPYLNGDVQATLSSIWDKAMNADGVSGTEAFSRAVLWGAMSSIEPPIPSRCNRKWMSTWANHEASCIDNDAKDTVAHQKTTTVEAGGTAKTYQKVTDRVVRSQKRVLTNKAGSVAARIKNSLPRVIGLLECAHLNKKWVQAVCTSIVQSGIGPGTRAKWRESMVKEGKCDDKRIGALIISTEHTIYMWAGVDDDISDNSGDGVIPSGLLDAGRDVMTAVDRERAFVTITAYSVGSPLFTSARVCPFCVYQELAGESFHNTHHQPRTGYALRDALIRFKTGTTETQVSGWLEAAALIHNKEQHALNGNIDRVDKNTGERSGLIKHLRQSFWDLPPIDSHEVVGPGVQLNDAEKYLGKVHYADPDGANTYYSNVGCMHQYLSKETDVGSILNVLSEGTVGSLMRKPANASGATRILGEKETYSGLFTDLSKKLQWVGVGYNLTHNHGALSLTETGVKMVDAASHPDPTTPNVLNPQRSNVVSGYITGAPMFGFLGQQSLVSKNDWRDLGVKTALYEDLRHNDFVQPSGVEWSWAKSSDLVSYIISLNKINQWHYNATFISPQALEASLRDGSGELRVGQGNNAAKWSLEDGSSRVISLPDNVCPGDIGTAIWVLSHLTYPLAWTVDCFEMMRQGGETSREAFVRTAGLVDLYDTARNIIFVVPGQYRDRVGLGGRSFPIGRTDRHGNADPGNPPLIYDLDVVIENLLYTCLTSKTSLREAFGRYVSSNFDGGLNWLEIDSIVTALVYRWPARVEAYRDEGTIKGRGAPEDVLESVYNLEADDGGQTPIRNTDYGGKCSVTSLDARVSGRQNARSNPHILIGRWSNLAALTVGVGVCRYKTFDVEDRIMVAARVRSGLHDRAMRASYLRKALECWKRDAGLRDEIAFPDDDPTVRQFWDRFVVPVESGFVGLEYLAKEFITPTIAFDWRVNRISDVSGSCLTGIRTNSSFWRDQISTEWGGFSVGSTGRSAGSEYLKDDRSVSWSYGCWIQAGQGCVDVPLESALMRINLHVRNWGITYRSHPNGVRIDGMPYLLESSITGEIANDAGWVNHHGSFTTEKIWGWGTSSFVRDWASNELKTVVIPSTVAVTVKSSDYTPGTWLSRGCIEGVAGPGLRRDYVGRAVTWKISDVEFRQVNSFMGHPERDVQVQSPDVPAQMKIEALQKEILVLQRAAMDRERVERNYDDQDAPPSAATLQQLGTHSSGQSVVDPTVKAATLGKYSQVLTGKAVQLGDPEPVVAPASIAKEGAKQKEIRGV